MSLASFFLAYGQIPAYIFCFIVGLLSSYRRIFLTALALLLFSSVYGFALKCTFHIPRTPTPHDFALPSGHMQSAVFFYGWIGLHFRKNSFPLTILLLLSFLGWSIMYFGYHHWIDIYSAAITASIGLGISFSQERKPFFLLKVLFVTILLLLYILIFYGYLPRYVVWQALGLSVLALIDGLCFLKKRT